MRRYGGWIVVALILAAWAWTQRAPAHHDAPITSTNSASTTSAQTPNTYDPAPITAPAQWPRPSHPQRESGSRSGIAVPPEALATLRDIAHSGPYAHRQDGSVFQNRERRLPSRPNGYYHEFTVVTPGSGDRGARRIVAGGDPPTEYFYSDDHYRNFRRIDASGALQ
ncbi:MAG: ribonuclease domain-containing protein [Luteimonas sp.]